MKAGIIVVVLAAVAIGLYLVFSTPTATLTGANLGSLTPAQLLALSPSQIATLTPSQQATIAALRANPSNYASNPFASPSPIQSNAGIISAGVGAIGSLIGGIGTLLNGPAAATPATSVTGGAVVPAGTTTSGPTLAQAGLVPPDQGTTGFNTGGSPVGPTYEQAGISPDLPLTAPSPSLIVPLAGDPAALETTTLDASIPLADDYYDPNAYAGTGDVTYS
jgi:hypothetical protein